ncbi:exosome non-catalytic core subunit rrp40 [Malassezia obtusa]|uniref:Ribosomal RNA-processing protein 40 n=1 Tax=Malassezia obtusa TaxID=76774 RepID=A0AAF0E3C4_9BASI|nr:exosome non-catalytic core subunit rrp40 [Malassezia obtusa]
MRGEKKPAGARPATVHGWWVDGNTRRYVPTADDLVIGQVTNRGPETYTVTLFSAHSATLPVLAFEGATRRNRPNLEVGALVYARVASAEPWTEPEISCVDAVTGKAEGMGELKRDPEQGVTMLWPVSLGLAHALYNPKHTLLSQVATHFPFEAAIGLNGLVWVRAATPEHVVALGAILRAADAGAGAADAMDEEQDGDPDDEARALPHRTSTRGELSAAEIAELIPQ